MNLKLYHIPFIWDQIGHLGAMHKDPSFLFPLVDEVCEVAFLSLTKTVDSVLDKRLDGNLVSRQIG